MIPIRENIKLQTAFLGWTAYRLAKESGVSASTVERYLKGDIDTTTKKADKMLSALLGEPLK